MPRDETPFTPERMALLNQLFEDIATEFAPEFDDAVMPEVILGGLRRILRTYDLPTTSGSRDARSSLEMCLRTITNAEGYYRRSRE